MTPTMVDVTHVHSHALSQERSWVEVRGQHRCTACGHRLTVNYVPPVQTRDLPIRMWLPEIIDRNRARRA